MTSPQPRGEAQTSEVEAQSQHGAVECLLDFERSLEHGVAEFQIQHAVPEREADVSRYLEVGANTASEIDVRAGSKSSAFPGDVQDPPGSESAVPPGSDERVPNAEFPLEVQRPVSYLDVVLE